MSRMPAMLRPERGVCRSDFEVDFSETAVEGREGKSEWCVEPAGEVIVSQAKTGKDIGKTWCTGCRCLKVCVVADWLVIGPIMSKAEGLQVGHYR